MDKIRLGVVGLGHRGRHILTLSAEFDCAEIVAACDIKPSNLMLTPLENGRYKVTLLDFGAVANPQVQNGGSTVAGTYGYMPPEQLMGQAQPASDIYALAALAVEMLSGTSPADIAVCDFKLVIEPYLQHLPHK